MAEPWKEKNLPEAGNSPTAPAQWNDETQEWDVYKGNKEIEEKLQVIEAKLDSVINDGAVSTQVTGSIVEEVVEMSLSSKSYRYTERNSGEGYKHYVVFVTNPDGNTIKVNEHIDLPIRAYRETILEGSEQDMVSEEKLIRYSGMRFMIQNKDDEETDITLVIRKWN